MSSKGSEIVFLEKKSISFNDKIDVILIPTRTESKKKNVSFNKIVKVFPIPRKEDFHSVSQDVWYSRDEITRVMFAYG